MKKLITEEIILNLYKSGRTVLKVSGNEIFTPSALDKIRELNISLEKESKQTKSEITANKSGESSAIKKIGIGSDHTGFTVKKEIIGFLSEKGFEVIDYGTYDEQSCDYPDFALTVAKNVVLNEVDAGIIFDATGIPSAITANKLPGIRAATCYNEFSAKSSREHNNSNVLVLGAKTLGMETIKSILDVWLKTDFLGGRHQRRLDKIRTIEIQILKNRKE